VLPSSRTILWRLLLLNAGIRVVLEAIGLASQSPHGHAVLPNAIAMWNKWDAHHYLRLAEVGYVDAPNPPPNADDPLYIVFFPFFPFAVRLVALVARDVVLSGLIVSFAASVGAGYFLYRLVRLDNEHDEAWRTVLLLYAFPTAYFLAAPYSEALFLFAVVASIYAARTRAWPAAGAAGALATGTRVTGIALAPALLIEAFSGEATARERVKRLAWSAVAGAGLGVYLLINQIVWGDPLHFLDVQRSHWFQHTVAPWTPLVDAVRAIAEGLEDTDRVFIFWGRITGFLFALPLLVLAGKRLRFADAVYGWAGLVLILSASWLLSLPRYLLVLYPLFAVGSQLTRSKRVFVPVVTVGSVIQAWFMWRYAVGEWTF
jgi:hypothetical protein